MSTVVISGGSGTLGRAIIGLQDLLVSHGVTKIRVISRDEQKQVSLMRSYRGQIPLDCFLGDVSDRDRMMFALKNADYLIHAAAQKHIDKFALDVPQGYKTNILGSQHVAEAFHHSPNAKSAILVSTDKAAAPITAYGVSKFAAEHSWLWNNTFQSAIKFGVCRYGNIFGSKGSVLETWTELAKKKLALPITDPDCTRFFMLIEEAAGFVVQCLFHHKSQVHIPKMKSALMYDVAAMIWQYWNPYDWEMPVENLGMRSTEKVHEILEIDGLTSEKAERLTPKELLGMYELWLSRRDK